MAHEQQELESLARLVVKDRVALGGLTDEQRAAALALAWATLPDAVMNERQVNEALKLALAGPVLCLATDHVELRRWLVDTGWLARDGYGREYRRLPPTALREVSKPWAALLGPLDVVAWAAAQRARLDAQRRLRRQAWEDAGQAA